MLTIDHICVGVPHLYEGAVRMQEETGLVAYDGGWFYAFGGAQRTIPLGQLHYLEINSIIDAQMAEENPFGRWFKKVISRGDHFMGWVLRVDTLEELEEFAGRNGVEIGKTWGRNRPDGRRNKSLISPTSKDHAWPRGLPMVQLWDDLEDHPDRVHSVVHEVEPNGISWLAVGDEETTRKWLGPEGDNLPMKYLNRPAGLYAAGIATADGGEIVIRRPSPTIWARWDA